LTPHLEISNDIATKKDEDTSGSQLYHRVKIHADRWHHRRDTCPRTDRQI